MKITRVSLLTNKTHEREIDVTPEQIAAWQRGMFIQHAMPHLSADDREFILSGVIPEEWDEAFPEE